MKVVFFSSVLNHHQIPFCNAMHGVLSNDFTFVATMDMEQQRKELGYVEDDGYPYLLKMHTSEEAYQRAYDLSQDADVMIAGVFPLEFLYDRMKKNKLTFRYSERYFREGKMCLLSPRAIYRIYKTDTRYRNKNLYMLCASGFAAQDMKFIKAYPHKMYKWGYFPQFKHHAMDELVSRKENPIPKLLWVGRFIPCKRAEDAIDLAERLKKAGYGVELDMIGSGALGGQLKSKVMLSGLDDVVHFKGSMKPKEVRQHMERANIYLFTSDAGEGWGAVLNEAMNSGCAVVVSDAIGSVPFLIKDNENGLIYESGDIDSLYTKVTTLLDDKEKQIQLGTRAYRTIADRWNAQAAADRFLTVSEQLLQGEKHYYPNGPMSKAD